ncbi:MAG: hypothetical protein U1E65_01440 [Myxococcota bacterium]
MTTPFLNVTADGVITDPLPEGPATAVPTGVYGYQLYFDQPASHPLYSLFVSFYPGAPLTNSRVDTMWLPTDAGTLLRLRSLQGEAALAWVWSGAISGLMGLPLSIAYREETGCQRPTSCGDFVPTTMLVAAPNGDRVELAPNHGARIGGYYVSSSDNGHYLDAAAHCEALTEAAGGGAILAEPASP